jgi:hypothetical protein
LLENPPLIAVKIGDVPIQSFLKKPMGFPLHDLRLSHVFPMFFPWFSHDLSIQLSTHRDFNHDFPGIHWGPSPGATFVPGFAGADPGWTTRCW